MSGIITNMEKIATRKSWKNHPLNHPEKISVEIKLTQNQYDKLIQGVIPHQMEDKWFVFHEDGNVHFHRSWTGNEVYKAVLVNKDNKYFISYLFIENTTSNFNYGFEEEINGFVRLLNHIIK